MSFLLALTCVVTADAQIISGRVATPSGISFPGVTVTATRAIPFQRVLDVTDAAGNYSLGTIVNPLSGTYSVVASAAGFTFAPASTNVAVSGRAEIVNFTTTADAPQAVTLPATDVTPTSVTMSAVVDPNGVATTLSFRYGVTPAFGSVSGSVDAGSGTSSVSLNVPVTGLVNGTNYYFRAEASNRFGINVGVTRSFSTPYGIPSVATLGPTDGGATTMRLNGRVNPNGASATAWFEIGTTTNYGFPAVTQNVGSGTNTTNFSQNLISLAPGTIYHYRAVAATSLGTTYGADALFSPVFNYSGITTSPSAYNGVGWADYDNDGKMDVLVAGATTAVWRNTGSGFANINAGLPYAADGAVAWGDYDNDGRLDILLTGWIYPDFNTAFARIYRNDGNGTFSNINAALPKVARSAVAWGDYDNDGRPDILLIGLNTATNPVTQLWRNTANGFALDASAALPSVAYGAVAWGDYDNDGRLDILLTGSTVSNNVNLIPGLALSQIWRNTGNGFVNINAGLPGVSGWNNRSAVAWGDYDADGRLDFVLAGTTNGMPSGAIAQVWHNTGAGFVLNTNAPLTGVYDCSVSWGDYDNDGRLDILLMGSTVNFTPTTEVWRNTGTGFVNIGAGLPGQYDGGAAWGDYDGDGRLDFVMSGIAFGAGQIWRNNIPAANVPPTAPSGPAMSFSNSIATLNWNAASDDTTPAESLTYNLRIGTTPGGSDVLAPASAANGFRRLQQPGNQELGLNARFKFELGTAYYWSVQAVDNTLAGSPFATEQSFKFLPVAVPPAAPAIIPGDLNGDGVVDQSELDATLANYWPNSPWLQMTNPMKLSDGFFQFALTNASSWDFSVEVSTNLTSWEFLGPAFPVYQFFDPQGTNAPQRHYRLRWP